MFTPEGMTRVLIAATKSQMEPVIREMYRQHLFHIEEFVEKDKKEYEGYRIGTPLPQANETSRELLRLRGINNAFMIRDEEEETGERRKHAQLTELIERELPPLEQEVEDLLSRRSRLDSQIKEYEQKIDGLKPFNSVPFDLELLRDYQTFSVFCGYISRDLSLDIPHEIFTTESKKERFIVLVVSNQHRSIAEHALQNAQFQAVPLPEETGPATNRIGYYEGQVLSVKGEFEEINRRLEEIKKQHKAFFLACNELLTSDVEMAEAPLRFATTGESFIVEGWVPTKELDTFRQGIHYATGGKVYVYELDQSEVEDVAPTEYHNVSFAKPTELLMDTYSRPRYSELDPTLLVSIIFPIFFGIILGDVGYGIILLVLSLGLRKFITGDEGKRLLNVLRNASISSIIFGILFSECFGFALPWSSILFSRHLNIGGHAGGHGPDVTSLMMMAIWIGILQITLGRMLGMANHARQDHGSHRIKAVMANLGWIMVLWGILFMLWAAFPMPLMPDFTELPGVVMGLNLSSILGIVLILLGVIFIVRDSALEIVELPTILSHTLSYARLVGVGLSSVAIAMVVNFIAIGLIIEPQLESLTAFGVIVIIMGALVFVIGHLLNTILGMLGGGLQSLRLQYVEFFTKFYKGGGKKYTPFGMKKRFLED
ncbi:MAG: V-type ATP synthase subunit I [Methanolinea sp.]|jgi:V/A-type H+-transporting ATPase subunit I|nr:V-type ATP synthase subunit I [Methanolinea sp.]